MCMVYYSRRRTPFTRLYLANTVSDAATNSFQRRASTKFSTSPWLKIICFLSFILPSFEMSTGVLLPSSPLFKSEKKTPSLLSSHAAIYAQTTRTSVYATTPIILKIENSYFGSSQPTT